MAGRITGWAEVEAGVGPPAFKPILVEMAVDRIYKSEPVSSITFLDITSYSDGEMSPAGRHGSSGACGAFNADPAGSYFVLGLHRNPNGALQCNMLTDLLHRPRAGRSAQ